MKAKITDEGIMPDRREQIIYSIHTDLAFEEFAQKVSKEYNCFFKKVRDGVYELRSWEEIE